VRTPHQYMLTCRWRQSRHTAAAWLTRALASVSRRRCCLTYSRCASHGVSRPPLCANAKCAWQQVARLAVTLLQDPRYGRFVVGLDLSGNPNRGRFDAFRPALEHARAAGLKVNCRVGIRRVEVANDSLKLGPCQCSLTRR
jgi:hypothetical protein